MFAPLRTFPAFAGAALLLLAVPACSLNPQPLPPGDQPEGGGAEIAADASVASDGSVFGGGGADGGTTTAADSGTPGSPAVDGGARADSGSTSDGGPSVSDADTEATVEASADGSTEE